jgi:nucleotide-binding universal stress UspA family protein
MIFHKILIASDLSPVSMPALRHGLALGTAGDASVLILHVNEKHHASEHWLVPPFEEDLHLYRVLADREEEASRRMLETQAGEALTGTTGSPQPRPVPETRVRSGRAAETIVAVAEEQGADLIVVGTRGRRGTLGSVAERVAREASCPVLIVPAEREGR